MALELVVHHHASCRPFSDLMQSDTSYVQLLEPKQINTVYKTKCWFAASERNTENPAVLARSLEQWFVLRYHSPEGSIVTARCHFSH